MKIRVLTSDYKDGIEMLNKVNEAQVLKAKEEIDYIDGCHYVAYMYSTTKNMREHIEIMLEDGWEIEKENEYVYIFSGKSEPKTEIKVPCVFYVKYMPGIYGVLYGYEETNGCDDNIIDILKKHDLYNCFDFGVFKSLSKTTNDEKVAVKKAMEYKAYIKDATNKYPEIIMRFLRHSQGLNEYDFNNDHVINNISEEEVYNLLSEHQNSFNNLSDSVLLWVKERYNKELN